MFFSNELGVGEGGQQSALLFSVLLVRSRIFWLTMGHCVQASFDKRQLNIREEEKNIPVHTFPPLLLSQKFPIQMEVKEAKLFNIVLLPLLVLWTAGCPFSRLSKWLMVEQ